MFQVHGGFLRVAKPIIRRRASLTGNGHLLCSWFLTR